MVYVLVTPFLIGGAALIASGVLIGIEPGYVSLIRGIVSAGIGSIVFVVAIAILLRFRKQPPKRKL
jgi:hypothetical protein